jgi:CBS domain-containing protein
VPVLVTPDGTVPVAAAYMSRFNMLAVTVKVTPLVTGLAMGII